MAPHTFTTALLAVVILIVGFHSMLGVRVVKQRSLEAQASEEMAGSGTNASEQSSQLREPYLHNIVFTNVSSGASEGDVRSGSGGAYIFPFFQYTSNASDAITGFTLVRDAGCPADFHKTNIDLNKGAGGSYNYLCFTRRSGAPVTDITFLKFVGAYVDLHYDYWHVHPQKLLDSGSFKHVYVGYKLEKKVVDLETLLFTTIAAANYAEPIREDPGVTWALVAAAVAGQVVALNGPASFVVGLLSAFLSEEDDDAADRAHIMEAVSHLVDDRLRVLKTDVLKNKMEDIKGRIEDAHAWPDKWLDMHHSFADLMNDAYGGGHSSCWTTPTSNNCNDWRNNGKALVLVVEFTELLLTVSTEVHDYFLDDNTSPENKQKAIVELDLLGADLKNGTDLLSEHFDHFQTRRKDFTSPDHGLLARVRCTNGGCEFTGPFDQMLATRICHHSVNERMLTMMRQECKYAGCNEGCKFHKDDGCTKEGAKSWHCGRHLRNKTPPRCYQKALDICIHEYKMAVDKDLETLKKKVNAIRRASAKVVKDAEDRSAVA